MQKKVFYMDEWLAFITGWKKKYLKNCSSRKKLSSLPTSYSDETKQPQKWVEISGELINRCISLRIFIFFFLQWFEMKSADCTFCKFTCKFELVCIQNIEIGILWCHWNIIYQLPVILHFPRTKSSCRTHKIKW